MFIDYTSLDLVNGGNEYARKFALQYFDDQGNPLTNGLLGEELASNDAFNAAKDNMILAFTNQLTVTDSTITPDPAGAPLCANVTSAITTLTGIVTAAIAAGSTAGLPTETSDPIELAKQSVNVILVFLLIQFLLMFILVVTFMLVSFLKSTLIVTEMH